MPDTLILIALISHVYKHLPSNRDFIITILPNKIGKHAQLKHFPNLSGKHMHLLQQRLTCLSVQPTFNLRSTCMHTYIVCCVTKAAKADVDLLLS